MSEEIKNTPVIRISLQVGLGETRALSFETYVAATSDATFIGAMLDKLNFCADRTKATYEVEALQKQHKVETDLLNAMKDNLVLLDNNVAERQANTVKRGPQTETIQEKQARKQVEIQIKDRTKRLADLSEEITAKLAMIGKENGDANSRANL